MSDILMLEAANIFVGDHDPEKSKHLKVQNLTLPTLEYATVDHMPGGGVMQVGWNMGVLNKLEPQFKLLGFDEETYRSAGVGSNKTEMFTCRGVIRRKTDGRVLTLVAVIRGSLMRTAPDQFERSSALGHDHTLSDVTRYKLTIGGREWFDVDFFASKRRRFGVDEYSEQRRALGLS